MRMIFMKSPKVISQMYGFVVKSPSYGFVAWRSKMERNLYFGNDIRVEKPDNKVLSNLILPFQPFKTRLRLSLH